MTRRLFIDLKLAVECEERRYLIERFPVKVVGDGLYLIEEDHPPIVLKGSNLPEANLQFVLEVGHPPWKIELKFGEQFTRPEGLVTLVVPQPIAFVSLQGSLWG